MTESASWRILKPFSVADTASAGKPWPGTELYGTAGSLEVMLLLIDANAQTHL